MFGIVADDLSGAIDASAPFATRGMSTGIPLALPTFLDLSGWDVIGFNTQTRGLASREIEYPVRNAIRRLLSAGCDRIFKKIDSTLRGHPGLEIKSAMIEMMAPYAFVTPSFPQNGRTVRDGILYVHGTPLRGISEGENIPCNTKTWSVIDMLESQSGQPTGLVDLGTVGGGESAIQRRIEKLISSDIKVLVFDAVTQIHLQFIASTIIRSFPDGLIVGSAGLSSAFAQNLSPMVGAYSALNLEPHQGNVLIVAGSINPVTVKQLDDLVLTEGIETIGIDFQPVVESENEASSELQRALLRITSAFKQGKDVVLRVTPRTKQLPPHTQSPTQTKTSAMISNFIQRLTVAVFTRSRPAALVLTGGETAYAVLSGLGTEGIVIHTELQPGVALGTVEGGDAHGTTVVTKAGGFGNKKTMAAVIKNLKRL